MEKTPAKIQPQRLKASLQKLIDIYSPTGKEEQVLGHLAGYLKRSGLTPTRQPLDDNRYNLLVLPEDPETATLVFVGHIDTVIAYDLDDYQFAEEGDRVIGLGAADMKGGCAAMIEAFLAFQETGAPLPAALALVVGEEEEGDGADALLEEYHFPWAVVGEPTNLKPCLSHYGYLELQLKTFGKRRHASLAGPGDNAVALMLKSLLGLTEYMDAHRPDVVCNIRDIFTSRAGFAVPEGAEAWIDLHLPPGAPLGDIAAELEERFLGVCDRNAPMCGQFRITTVDYGYELPAKGDMVARLQEIFTRRGLTWDAETFRSHSDANQLWAAGVKPIMLGPGRLDQAHTPEESVSFAQVCEAAAIYLDVLNALAAEPTADRSQSEK